MGELELAKSSVVVSFCFAHYNRPPGTLAYNVGAGGGGVTRFLYSGSIMTIDPRVRMIQCRDGARRAFNHWGATYEILWAL